VTIIQAQHDSHRRQIDRRGTQVTFRRTIGAAPNTQKIEATVTAVVSTMVVDTYSTSRTGYSSVMTGSLDQTQRRILVMAEDLDAAGYPLPIKQNDGIKLDSGEWLNITQVDAQTRAVAGAIEMLASGV
jgi:hypothetical protein